MAENQVNFGEMSEVDLIAWMGTDAQKWTQAFLFHTDLANAGSEFQSTVNSWFANAIEWGKSDGMSSALEEMKHAARNHGMDTSEIYTPGQMVEATYEQIPEDHQCL